MYKSIREQAEALNGGDTTSEELTSSRLELAKQDTHGKVFLGIREQAALEAARTADQRLKAGKPLSLLDGIPIAVKGNMAVEGMNVSCASKFLRDYISPYDATVVRKLSAAGAVIIGSANLDEFAMGSSNENSAYGPVLNPWDHQYVPGGSSGGSVAAVAGGVVFGSLGSDTGGSIRLPASYCGAVGIKPSYGRVSRYGLVAFASSLDQIGPIGWYVEDAALMLKTIAGRDPRDSTSVDCQVDDYVAACTKNSDALQGLRIGIAKQFSPQNLNTDIQRSFDDAVDVLKNLGATFVEVDLEAAAYAVSCYYVIASAEASANLSRFDGIRYTSREVGDGSLKDIYFSSRTQGFGAEVQRRIMLGTFVLSSGYYDSYYGKAQKVRTCIRQGFTKAFEKCDIIVSPTSPTPAFKIGEMIENPLEMYLTDSFTTPASLAGLTAMSVPTGFNSSGMPCGMQIMAAPFDEKRMINVAYQYEQATSWKEKTPNDN